MAPNRARPRRRPWTLATLAGVASLILPTITLARTYSVGFLPLQAFLYPCAASCVTFLLYGYDKMQARNNEWRVKETTLHFWALIGGWPGALAGMHYFQHKTRKTSFQVPFWIIVLIWEAVSWKVMSGLSQDVFISSMK